MTKNYRIDPHGSVDREAASLAAAITSAVMDGSRATPEKRARYLRLMYETICERSNEVFLGTLDVSITLRPKTK